MPKVVVDACLSAKWVLQESLRREAIALLREWRESRTEICVPPLWENEVDSVFRQRVWHKVLSQEEADDAQDSLDKIIVTVVSASRARRRAREIAKQANQRRVYDSVYAALAELEECDFWTADETFFKAVRGFLPHVKYLGDYSIASEDISEENCAPISKQ